MISVRPWSWLAEILHTARGIEFLIVSVGRLPGMSLFAVVYLQSSTSRVPVHDVIKTFHAAPRCHKWTGLRLWPWVVDAKTKKCQLEWASSWLQTPVLAAQDTDSLEPI